MYYAGIDGGSLSTDTVIIDSEGRIVSYDISPTGANSRTSAEKSMHNAVERAGITRADIVYSVATGYGRISLDFVDKAVTEITCHGRGAWTIFPRTRTIIDIGGQDSKAIKVGEGGKVLDFIMNDKCAAGTGRFLEVMAKALEIGLEEMGPLSLKSTNDISISSTCTVFAESEVISLVAQATPKEDIINGIHRAICNRIGSMLERIGVDSEVTITGGVAKNSGIVKILEQKVGAVLNVPDEPQIVGALGAALVARDLASQHV